MHGDLFFGQRPTESLFLRITNLERCWTPSPSLGTLDQTTASASPSPDALRVQVASLHCATVAACRLRRRSCLASLFLAIKDPRANVRLGHTPAILKLWDVGCSWSTRVISERDARGARRENRLHAEAFYYASFPSDLSQCTETIARGSHKTVDILYTTRLGGLA